MNNTDRALLILTALGMVLLMLMVFVIIPEERTQGFVQKIFYVHVPCAWVAFLAFGVTGVLGGRYLFTRDMRHDRLAAASAEVGLIYVTLVVITGPLWARPVWGIFWTWDLRLTTTFILWLMFLAYGILRRSVGDPERRATLSAVVGLVGFLDVPMVYMANRIRASQHPSPVVGGGEDSGLAPEFLATLLIGIAVFTLMYVLILRLRSRAAEMEDRIEVLWTEASSEG